MGNWTTTGIHPDINPRFVYVTMLLTMLTGKYLGTHDIYDIYDMYDIYDIYAIYIIYIHEWLTGWAYFSVKQLLVDNQNQFCSHKLALSRFPVTVVRPFGKPMFWNPQNKIQTTVKSPIFRPLCPCPENRLCYHKHIWAIYDIYGISMIFMKCTCKLRLVPYIFLKEDLDLLPPQLEELQRCCESASLVPPNCWVSTVLSHLLWQMWTIVDLY